MKNGILGTIGTGIMKLSPIKVIIIDDVSSYFNEQMLSIASANSAVTFERYEVCDAILLKNLISNPRDILIIDIKGTVSQDIGNDGFDVAKHVYENTSTFVAVTSAHKYHLKNRTSYGDYVLEDRLMTPIDFCHELNNMIEIYLKIKLKVYKKISYRIGSWLFNLF
ncbi:MAG: hypothetical protein WD607_05195 [Candidatus Paceibacterota bacterium]